MRELTDLHRAAAANLVALRNGDVKRQLAREAAARKTSRQLDRDMAAYERQAAKDLKAEIKALYARLDEIEAIWEDVEADFPEDMKRGAHEELDAERDRISERLYKLESY